MVYQCVFTSIFFLDFGVWCFSPSICFTFSFSRQMSVTLDLLTWNVNGANKLRSFLGHSRCGIGNPDVLFLQETWLSSDSEQLEIDGYVAFHAPGIPTHGRDACGLSSFFKLTTFAGGQLEKKDTPVPWVSTVRWSDGDSGVLFVNIYAAVHTSGVLEQDFELVNDYITDLRSSFGNDQLILAGDFNADRWRRPTPVNKKESLSLQLLRELDDDNFQVNPRSDVITYVDSSTTLDYVVASPGVLVNSFEVLPVGLCQHLPVFARLTVPISVQASALPLRSPNLLFVPKRVERVRELLLLIEPQLAGAKSVDDFYSLIESAFLNCGVEKRVSSQSFSSGSWWKYVSKELRTEVDKLEAASSDSVRRWMTGAHDRPSTEEVVDLRRRLGEKSREAFQQADKALQEEMAKGFVDASLCWRILKKI